MNSTSVNASSEVIPFDNNVMATINKLKNQHKCADLAGIYKELKKYPFIHYSPLSTLVLDRQIKTPTIEQQPISPSILENELFLDTMLKKSLLHNS